MMRCRVCGEESRNGDLICPACRQGVKRTTPEEEIRMARETKRSLENVEYTGAAQVRAALDERIKTIKERRAPAWQEK